MPNQTETHVQIQRRELLRKIKILVVDDNADILDLTKTILEMADYETLSALSGKKALEMLSEIDPPDLILLDMRMEDMSGPDFLTVLEEKKPEIIKKVPIVFLTGMDKVPLTKASGFIRKPFNIDEFLISVRHFIEIGIEPAFFKH